MDEEIVYSAGYFNLIKYFERSGIKDITDTSMGCRCGYSLCSICQNKAVTEDDFCNHIVNYKGTSYNGLPVFEDNRDIEFFENSFVCTGADPSAKIMEKVASKISRVNNRKSSNQTMNNIINETNQRNVTNKINTFADKLKNLPWS